MSTENEVQPVTEDLDAFTHEFYGRNPEPKAEAQTSADTEEGEETGEQPEVEQEEVEETADSPTDDDSEVIDEPVAEAPKPKQTVQDRINELVKQREDAKREGDAKLEALRQEFAEKLAALTPKEPETAKAAEPGEPTPDDLKEDGTPKYELGEFDPQYIRDLTRHTLQVERNQAAAKAAEEAQANQAKQAQEALVGSWNEKVTTATTQYPDFMEKGQALLSGFDGLEPSYAEYLSTVLMSMDKGPDVLYYLSNNPAEAVTIVNSGAQKATLALGRIEAKFLEADATKTLAKPKVSKAPAPPPANARARGSNGAFVSVPPDTDDLEAFQQEFFAKKK